AEGSRNQPKRSAGETSDTCPATAPCLNSGWRRENRITRTPRAHPQGSGGGQSRPFACFTNFSILATRSRGCQQILVQFRPLAARRGVQNRKSLPDRHLRLTLAPPSSSCFFIFSASSLLMFSFTGLGKPSTSSL